VPIHRTKQAFDEAQKEATPVHEQLNKARLAIGEVDGMSLDPCAEARHEVRLRPLQVVAAARRQMQAHALAREIYASALIDPILRAGCRLTDFTRLNQRAGNGARRGLGRHISQVQRDAERERAPVMGRRVLMPMRMAVQIVRVLMRSWMAPADTGRGEDERPFFGIYLPAHSANRQGSQRSLIGPEDKFPSGGMVELDTGNGRYLIRFSQTLERQAGWTWALFNAVRKLSA